MRFVVGATIAMAVLSSCGSDGDAPLVGYERDPAPQVGELTLPAVRGDEAPQEIAFRAPEGGLMLVYFGYTSCPDVCPTTLSDIRTAVGELGDDGDRVQLAMVSIDPEVDAPEVLAAYVQSFDPDALAVHTLDDARLREVATAFGADYGTEEVDGEMSVFHTGSVYAVDSTGELILTWPFGTTAEHLSSDLGQLLGRAT